MPTPAERRDQSASARLDAADRRDELAQARDAAADVRHDAAHTRNRVMAERDAVADSTSADPGLSRSAIMIRAAGQRRRAARQRAESAQQRALADLDLDDAAEDREEAARERLHALVDRELLADQLASAETDVLTGARTRAAGLRDLDRELDRCRRNAGMLVVAYVDVVGLKHVNDTEGHGAGDELLRSVVTLIKEHLRSYDLIVRVGGDEFLFVMPDMALPDARRRFGEIADALASLPRARAITIGFAQHTPEDTATELIARADRELIVNRRAHDDSRPSLAADSSA